MECKSTHNTDKYKFILINMHILFFDFFLLKKNDALHNFGLIFGVIIYSDINPVYLPIRIKTIETQPYLTIVIRNHSLTYIQSL
jgi:hypothetical protein